MPINRLIKEFPNVYQFCNGDTSKFVLLLRKAVYPYEYMDSWERFNETSLPDKKAFYSELYLEHITDKDYTHTQKVFEEFNFKNLGDYYDLYIYELDPAHFLSAPGLSWQACLKKTGARLKLLTNIDMLLMVEKGIRGGICHAIHRYAKSNNKYMKNCDKNIESSYLMYLDANNLYEWAYLKDYL